MMVEFLSALAWWHWVIFGLVLVVSEIIVPLFVVIWFGIAAIIVGLIDLIIFLTLTTKISLWLLISIVLLTLWFKYFKKERTDPSGQPEFGLDSKGVVTKEITPTKRGEVVFEKPVLGSSTWQASSDEVIREGERVKIVEVLGQLLRVRKE
jgi:membrane protein implicated in regulation of membrane protease activity